MELRARSSWFRPFHKLDPPLPIPYPVSARTASRWNIYSFNFKSWFSLLSLLLFVCNIRWLKCERSSTLTVSRIYGQQQPRGRDLKLQNAAPPLCWADRRVLAAARRSPLSLFSCLFTFQLSRSVAFRCACAMCDILHSIRVKHHHLRRI